MRQIVDHAEAGDVRCLTGRLAGVDVQPEYGTIVLVTCYPLGSGYDAGAGTAMVRGGRGDPGGAACPVYLDRMALVARAYLRTRATPVRSEPRAREVADRGSRAFGAFSGRMSS